MAEFRALWGFRAGFCLLRKGRKGLQVGSWVVAVVTAVMAFFAVCALKGSASLALIFPLVSQFAFVFICHATIIVIIIIIIEIIIRTVFTDHRHPGVSQAPRCVHAAVTHGVVDPAAKSIIVAGGAAELEPFPGTAAGCKVRVHELARLGQLSLLLGVGGEHAFLLRVGQHIGRIGLLEDFGQGGCRGGQRRGEGGVLQRSGVGGRVRGEVGFGTKGGRGEIGEGDGWCLSIDTGVHS